jgi:hypothetical protein
MRFVILISAATLAVASCAQPGTPSDTAAFAREIAGRVAGPPQACIGANPQTNLRVVDASTVAYEVGTTMWVNRLPSACPALQPMNTLIVEPGTAGQYCRGDHIRGLEPGGIIPGPTCFLSDWVPYRRP